MPKKLGRNQPCWCGSGIKYKKCHLEREEEKPLELWEIHKQFKKSFGKKFCSCPEKFKKDCKGKIINAHTVSKSSSLKRIAKNNHVYGIDPDIFKMDRTGGRFEPELIGINKASTFTGFCSEHDKKLFSSFENKKFTLDKEKIFFLSYRALAREHFSKTAHSESREIMQTADRGRNPFEQFQIQTLSKAYSNSLDIGVRDSQHHKKEYDKVLENNNYASIRAFVIEFDKIIPILCSGNFYPEIDFAGNEIQSFSDTEKILDTISFSIITEDEKSFAIFSWLPNSNNACSILIDSLEKLSNTDKVAAIFKLTFTIFENTFINPDWWESKSEDIKEYIVNALQPTTDLNYADKTKIDFFDCNIIKVQNI